MSQSLVIFLLVSLALSQLTMAQGKYNFGVPGQWSSGGKRGRSGSSYSFSLPGSWGAAGGKKRIPVDGGDEDCPSTDAEQLRQSYADIMAEAERINRCLEESLSANDKKTK